MRGTSASDAPGKRYGRLTLISYHKSTVWLCQCDCGKEHFARSADMRRGRTMSCGCLKREKMRERPPPGTLRHGHAVRGHSREYETWAGMKRRCNNPKDHNYPNYGGRGITICDRWRSFECFLEDMGDRPPDTTLDRIDNDGPYEKANCRWATSVQQSLNQRSHPPGKSGFLGVSRMPSLINPWRASITVNYKRIHIGVFPTPEAAYAAYRMELIKRRLGLLDPAIP